MTYHHNCSMVQSCKQDVQILNPSPTYYDQACTPTYPQPIQSHYNFCWNKFPCINCFLSSQTPSLLLPVTLVKIIHFHILMPFSSLFLMLSTTSAFNLLELLFILLFVAPSNSSVELPPELCSIIMSLVPYGTLYSFSYVPSIMHRIESLLIAANLKKMVQDHCMQNVSIPTAKVRTTAMIIFLLAFSNIIVFHACNEKHSLRRYFSLGRMVSHLLLHVTFYCGSKNNCSNIHLSNINSK